MPPPNSDDDTARFHRIVLHGNLDELRAALDAGADVNAPDHVGMTALMRCLYTQSLAKTQLLIQFGADPEIADDFNGTALRHAVTADFVDGVRYLLSLGVDRGYAPKYPLKPISYDYPVPMPDMPASMKSVLSQQEWKDSVEKTIRAMRESARNPKAEPVIADVQSVAVLKLLGEAGDDLNRAPKKIKRELVGLSNDGELSVAPAEFRRHRARQFGGENPERMDFPFWKDMIRTGVNAYVARTKFESGYIRGNGDAVWCYDRNGSTSTPLDDGRFVQIGGEHEDHYDPDFCIYNDVVVHDGRGGCEIYGYPSTVFPPTDFHSATLTPDGIYIVGCLGYPNQRRPGFTPVFRLALNTWRIQVVETGGEMPGWIFKHAARYDAARNTIVVTRGEIITPDDDGRPAPNDAQFELDLTQRMWRRTN